jgi:hypothetical protein
MEEEEDIARICKQQRERIVSNGSTQPVVQTSRGVNDRRGHDLPPSEDPTLDATTKVQKLKKKGWTEEQYAKHAEQHAKDVVRRSHYAYLSRQQSVPEEASASCAYEREEVEQSDEHGEDDALDHAPSPRAATNPHVQQWKRLCSNTCSRTLRRRRRHCASSPPPWVARRSRPERAGRRPFSRACH